MFRAKHLPQLIFNERYLKTEAGFGNAFNEWINIPQPVLFAKMFVRKRRKSLIYDELLLK